jgi:hypothetical protein
MIFVTGRGGASRFYWPKAGLAAFLTDPTTGPGAGVSLAMQLRLRREGFNGPPPDVKSIGLNECAAWRAQMLLDPPPTSRCQIEMPAFSNSSFLNRSVTFCRTA